LTPLHIASERGHPKIVELLLDYHINSRYFKYVALENEIDVNIQDDRGQTALIKSIIHNNLEITRLLIENDCDVNKGDSDYKTALHYALFEGKDDIAIFLVLYGADINATSKTGDKPIEFANAKLKKALMEIYNEISGRNDEEEKSS
jgi:ankyrin repeat protein